MSDDLRAHFPAAVDLRFRFQLAAELGMTPSEVGRRHSPAELLLWRAYFATVNQEAAKDD